MMIHVSEDLSSTRSSAEAHVMTEQEKQAIVDAKTQEAVQLYDELIQKNDQKINQIRDKVTGLQSMTLPTLAVSLEEFYTKKLHEAELDSEQERETIRNLIKVEADYKK